VLFWEFNYSERGTAQKIVHVEEACKSVLEAICKLDEAKLDDDLRQIERDLQREFKFLGTLDRYD
jgi:hypothetical protein